MVLLGECCLLSFFSSFFTFQYAPSAKSERHTKKFSVSQSGLDDRDIVHGGRSQKIVATLNDLRGMLKQGKQWEAKSKSTEEQRENFEHLLVAVEESTKTIKTPSRTRNVSARQICHACNDNKTNSNIPPETLSEYYPKNHPNGRTAGRHHKQSLIRLGLYRRVG